MKVSYLPNISARAASLVDLDLALSTASHGVKSDLPAIIPSAYFNEGVTTADLAAHTGLLGIDVDVERDAGDVAWPFVLAWPHTYAAQRSASGGVHIFVRVNPVPAVHSAVAEHRDLARRVHKVLAADLGLTADPACIDVVRRFFVPGFDHYSNATAIPLVPALALLQPGERHDAMLKWALEQARGRRSKEVILSALVDAERRLQSGHSKADLERMVVDLNVDDTQDGVVLLESVAQVSAALVKEGRFDLRRNVMTATLQYKAGDAWVNIPGSASAFSALIEDALPPFAWRPVHNRPLSNVIPDTYLQRAAHHLAAPYNPAEELLARARQAIITEDTDFGAAARAVFRDDSAYTRAVFEAIYTDVALRMLLCGHPERAVLPTFFTLLVGPQGCGKSAFVEELLPSFCARFVGQLTAGNIRDAVNQVSARFLLEYPEVGDKRDRFSMLTPGEFRSLVTSPFHDVVNKYERSPTEMRNNAVIVATANPDGSPLLDGIGGRRQAVVTYPSYDSVEAALAAGLAAADYLRVHRDALFALAVRRADEILAQSTSDLVSVAIPKDLMPEQLESQRRVADDLAGHIARALLDMYFDLPGWRTRADPMNPDIPGYCERGGAYGPSLRALASKYAGEHISSQRINATLLLQPGVSRATRVSPLHHNRGLLVSPEAAAAMAAAIELNTEEATRVNRTESAGYTGETEQESADDGGTRRPQPIRRPCAAQGLPHGADGQPQ